MQDSLAVAALPYHDPPIKTILVLSSFLLLSNAVNYILDYLLYCGLVGQVLIGVTFGVPGAEWLDEGTEKVIVQLGYLGLIFLVYEGGLKTNFKTLKANAAISTLVALTGICLPIAFAFCLQSLASATSLQAFAAGAALCSTSLGTTMSILSSSGLTDTSLGTVLTSAAMMDDVVGLVLVQVISKVGLGSSSFHAISVVRPVVVSIGLALFVLLTCLYLVKPFSSLIGNHGLSAVMRAFQKHPDEAAVLAHAALLFGSVAAASYAGSSNLIAAYLAGASISWYYSEVDQPGDVQNDELTNVTRTMSSGLEQQPGNSQYRGTQPDSSRASPSQESNGQMRETQRAQDSSRGVSIYRTYVEQPVARIFKPFFFASIGFSIPITRMFTGAVVWRGIVFTILMLIGKLVTGIWFVRVSAPSGTMAPRIKAFLNRLFALPKSYIKLAESLKGLKSEVENTADSSGSKTMPEVGIALAEQDPRQSSDRPWRSGTGQPLSSVIPSQPQSIASTSASRSLYPAAIIGTAMMARGEVGFLIAALAESTGIFASHDESASREDHGSEIYLVVIWAISLCTIIGPVTVGSLVRRVKKLQRQRRERGGGEDPLGIWGVL